MSYFKISKLFIFFALALLCGCSNTLDSGGEEIPSTVIVFTLPATTHVNLWIENSYKTTVATLIDEVKSAGTHRATFEAIDSNGNNLPEGIYTYHIETERFSQSKILYLKYR